MNPHFNAVSPRYFKTLGMTMKAGREFDDRDHFQSPKAVVVNETFAKRYFPGRSPLGYKIAYGRGPQVKPNMEIVGVVTDSRYDSMRDEPTRQVFVCHPQYELTTGMVVYVRTSQTSERMFNTVRNELRGMDPGIPIYNLITMEDQLDSSLSIERLVAFLSSAYGALAAALAVLGLYGVTAYGVARRSREIGIRMALGAEAGSVVRMVLREVLLLAGIGILVALPLVWWLTQLVRAQLYGIEPRDPLTLAAAALGLLAVAIAAGAGPAIKASRLDPAGVLRYE